MASTEAEIRKRLASISVPLEEPVGQYGMAVVTVVPPGGRPRGGTHHNRVRGPTTAFVLIASDVERSDAWTAAALMQNKGRWSERGGDVKFSLVEGFHMKMEMVMNMMGTDMKTTDEVVEIAEKPAPPGTYSVPEGYSKQEKFTFEDMQRR